VDTKLREVEKKLRRFDEVGGMEELVKCMTDAQEERKNQYVPKSGS